MSTIMPFAPQASTATNSTTGAPASRAPYGSGSGPATGAGGTVVSPGTSLFTLARIDILRIQVNVPQAYAPNIRVGQKAQILVREFPNAKFFGAVARTSRSIDPQSRTMLTELQIKNPTKTLLPGMFGQIVFHIPRAGQPLLVPDSALISDSRGTLLGTVGSDKKVHLTRVQVGRDYGKVIEIIQGLNPGDMVVLNPSDATVEGTDATPTFGGGDASGSAGGSGGDKSKGGGSASPAPDTGQRYGGTDLDAPLTPTMQPQPKMEHKAGKAGGEGGGDKQGGGGK